MVPSGSWPTSESRLLSIQLPNCCQSLPEPNVPFNLKASSAIVMFGKISLMEGLCSSYRIAFRLFAENVISFGVSEMEISKPSRFLERYFGLLAGSIFSLRILFWVLSAYHPKGRQELINAE